MLQFLFQEPLETAHAIVIPLQQTEQLTEQLTQIAQDFGLAVDLLKADFKAERKEVFVSYTNHQVQKIFLIGLGKPAAHTAEWFRQAIRSWTHKYKAQVGKTLYIDLSNYTQLSISPEAALEALVAGSSLGISYVFNPLKKGTGDNKDLLSTIIIGLIPPPAATKIIEQTHIIVNAQLRTMEMVNLPSNHFTPASFAQQALDIAATSPYTTAHIWRGQEVKDAGLAALWAVGKASAEEPHFCILEYKPPHFTKTVALVGKGLTYDSGGMNIKTQGMLYMKSDMAGGATVLGTLEVIAKQQLPIHLIAIVPACENMISGNAYKPGEIINSYSGYTIEVDDTDAEGRIVLADGLAYAIRNYNPDVLIDIATLTGASIIALGTKAAAMLTNNEDLAQAIYQVGQQIDEKVWRLPLWDDYTDQLKTDLADIKNYGGPAAGCITGAKFLEKFTNNHTAYVHLDVAGVVYGDTEFSKNRIATGFGVRLLATVVSTF